MTRDRYRESTSTYNAARMACVALIGDAPEALATISLVFPRYRIDFVAGGTEAFDDAWIETLQRGGLFLVFLLFGAEPKELAPRSRVAHDCLECIDVEIVVHAAPIGRRTRKVARNREEACLRGCRLLVLRTSTTKEPDRALSPQGHETHSVTEVVFRCAHDQELEIVEHVAHRRA